MRTWIPNSKEEWWISDSRTLSVLEAGRSRMHLAWRTTPTIARVEHVHCNLQTTCTSFWRPITRIFSPVFQEPPAPVTKSDWASHSLLQLLQRPARCATISRYVIIGPAHLFHFLQWAQRCVYCCAPERIQNQEWFSRYREWRRCACRVSMVILVSALTAWWMRPFGHRKGKATLSMLKEPETDSVTVDETQLIKFSII